MDNCANQDEALKCVNLAWQCVADGALEKAERLLAKSTRMFPTPEAAKLQSVINMKKSGTTGGTTGGTVGGTTPGATSATSSGASKGSGTSNAKSSKATAAPPTPAAPPQFTPAQVAITERVLRAKDLYGVLGVEKDAAEDSIKKAYKKLALQLHPDKNQAPRAEEAFKRLSKACQILSNSDKRNVYNHTMNENESSTSNTTFTRTGQDFMSPQDFFEAFFGGPGSGSNIRMRRRGPGFMNGHVGPGGTRHVEVQTSLGNLIQTILVFVFIMVMASKFFSFLGPAEPDFSMSKSTSFTHKIHTESRHVPFYINPAKAKKMTSKQIIERDHQVELTHYTSACRTEHTQLWKQYEYARGSGRYRVAGEKLKEIKGREKESANCQVAMKIQSESSNAYRVSSDDYYASYPIW